MRLMKPRAWWLAGVLLGALLGTGCGGPSPAEKPQPAAPAPTPAAAAPSDTLEILSVLSVEREVDLMAQRDGVVEEILYDQGARVEKGTVLARLDDRELRAQLDRARADLESAQNDVKYNEAELKANQAAYRRAQEMHKLGLSSDAELEEKEFKATGSGHDLAGARARLDRSQAELRLLELELEKTGIRAPFGGVVSLRYIRPGQTVTKDEKCFRLSQLAPLQVQFLVPEIAARRPRAGELVNVAPMGDTQRVYVARIQRVSPTVDPASGSYDVTAVLTGSDLAELRPGMAVKVLWGGSAGHSR